MSLSLTITTKDSDTIHDCVTLAALLEAYHTYRKGGEFSADTFTPDRALVALQAVIAATDLLFFTHIDWASLAGYDGLEESLGIFGETLIALGRFLTTKTGRVERDFNFYPIKQDRSA